MCVSEGAREGVSQWVRMKLGGVNHSWPHTHGLLAAHQLQVARGGILEGSKADVLGAAGLLQDLLVHSERLRVLAILEVLVALCLQFRSVLYSGAWHKA